MSKILIVTPHACMCKGLISSVAVVVVNKITGTLATHKHNISVKFGKKTGLAVL